MELGQDLKSHCNHAYDVYAYICESFDGCFLFGKCLFHQLKTLCRNQLKLSALFTRDEILAYKPLQTLLKNLGPVLSSSIRFTSGFPSLVNILSGVLSNPIKKNKSSLLA